MKTMLAADLFCGAGGASTGLRRASEKLGLRTQLLAINHWPIAIETHTLNHPDVRHLCESIERINPREAIPGGRLQLLIAAPECTHHSTARGGRPINDQSRATAWHILKWCQELYIDNVLIENVPEFREWGPLGANHRPLKSRKGETYRAFLEALRSLGYKVEDRILNAADYGDPTTRRRLFIIARRGNRPITWPQPSHSKTGGRSLFGKTEKWRAARDIIDWTIPGQSIFNRKRPLSQKTLARIFAGLDRFGGADIKPFLIVLRNHADARSLDRPLPALSAQGQHMGLVEPFLMPVTHGSDTSRRERSLDEPCPTITGAHRGEIALCEPLIVPNNQNNRAKTLDEPLPTVTGGGRHMLVEPFVLQQQSGGVARSTDEPFDGAQMLVEPFMVSVAHGDNAPGSGRGNSRRIRSVDEPMPAVTASGKDYAVVEPFIVTPGGANLRQPSTVNEPLPTVTCSDRFAVVEPFLIPHYGERPGQETRTHSVDEPVPTIPASGDGKFEVVQPFLLSTGSNGAPRSVADPTPTVVGAASMSLVDAGFIASYYGTQNISPVSEPLPTVTTKDRFALVMPVVNGRALDIRLRMLKPHELARAMSFGDDYQFAGNQGDQVKQIGNAWPCRLGEALIHSVIEDYAAKAKKPRRLKAIA